MSTSEEAFRSCKEQDDATKIPMLLKMEPHCEIEKSTLLRGRVCSHMERARMLVIDVA
jgi:hypothetical protein